VALDLNIPGLYLLHDFVSPKEEEVRSFVICSSTLSMLYSVFCI
jgi:hypothetical protein